MGGVMATSLGVGHWGAAVASSPPAAEAEANWGMLERDMFFPGEMLCSPGAPGFGYGLHLGIYSWLLGAHPIHLAMPHLFFEVCTAKEVFVCCKPQGNGGLDCQATAGAGWKDALIFILRVVLPPRLEAGWAPRGGGDNGFGGLVCSSIYGFFPEVLVGPSPPNFTRGMESRTVDEDWGRSCLSDALPKRVPQASQPLSCFFQGKSGKDEKETRTLQLRSLQYLERYIYLILFNAYLHLEKKDSWQRPFSLWMREVRLSLPPPCIWRAPGSRPPSLFYI